jgi:hypothetical protein
LHEIDEHGFTHSLCSPKGGPWGSTNIDNNFQNLLFEIFGPEIKEEGTDFGDVLAAFERAKINFSPNQENDVAIPMMQFQPINLHG